jgi:hypothetical protein
MNNSLFVYNMKQTLLTLLLITSTLAVPYASLNSITGFGELSNDNKLYDGDSTIYKYTIPMKIKDALITTTKLAVPIATSIYAAHLLSGA